MRFFLIFTAALFFYFPNLAYSDPCPIMEIDYDLIISRDQECVNNITEVVKNFDFDKYTIRTVDNLGSFFLEADEKRDWIKDVLRANCLWESYIAPFIQQYVLPGTLALDIGSHIGTHTLSISRAVGKNGKVIAFDPQPKTFSELFMNCQLNGANNVQCFWGALGDKEDDIALPNFHPEVEVTYLYDFCYGDSGNTAPMVTLDSLNLNNISFMKVDVDGCDDIFLDGAKETILRNKPVFIMEIMGGFNYDCAPPDIQQRILNTQKKIMDLGYELQRIAVHDYLALPLN